jgi:UDP-N-acetylmuramyl pentapeptide phosphotransferase/UDP-N-acetylglucosamine-1-phosphate transferase
MSGVLTVLPFIVTLVLWAHWHREGETHPAWKWAVLLLSLYAVRLQFFSDDWIAGLVLQVVLAIGLLLWNRWHDARFG